MCSFITGRLEKETCCFIYLRNALHLQLFFFLQKEASKSGNLKVTFMAEEKIKKLKKRNSELVSIARQLEDKAKKLQEEKVTAQVCCSLFKYCWTSIYSDGKMGHCKQNCYWQLYNFSH